LRASVGSTEARNGRLARFGVVGPTRATRLSVRVQPVKRACWHHDIDPVAYLQDILGRQPSQPTDQLEGLLPDVWFTSHPRARGQPAA
jgi:hypothetical protein